MSLSFALELYKELRGHKGDVNYCVWSPENRTLCSCSGDKTLRLWDTQEGKEISPSPIKAHHFYVNCCAYSPAGDLLASGSSDATVKLWSTASWSVVSELSGHSGAVRGLAFSPDGCLLASASDDMMVRIWDVGSTQCMATLDKHTGSVNTCCFAPSGWLIVTGSNSGDVILFDCYKKKSVARILRADELGINSIQVSPKCDATDSEFIFACVGGDGTVRLWTVIFDQKSVLSVTKRADLLGHAAGIFSCCFSVDGQYLATGDADKYVIVWDMKSLSAISRLQPHSRYVTCVSFSLDGRYLATGSNDKTVKLWRIKNGPAECQEQPEADQGKGSADALLLTQSSSKLSAVKWTVDEVCAWLDAVSTEQNSGSQIHPDDLRGAQRISRSLEGIVLSDAAGDLAVGDFHCPITQEILKDPVVAADGFSYERSAITSWFSKGRRTSPSTNLPLPNTLLVPNKHLRLLIEKRNK